MHRIRTWAHRSAHANNYNPWSHPAAGGPPLPAGNSLTGASNAAETENEKPNVVVPRFRRILENVKKVLFHNWVNVLLVFVPVGIAVHFAGVNPNIVFALNAIAIIPLAGLLTFATESVAHRLGPTLGALLNVSFGNAVELIIFIIALVKNEIRVVQASLAGSILANLLLILGMAFFVGGLEYREQFYDSTATQMSACLLALAVLSLLIPTAFHASFSNNILADSAVLKLSRGTSVILLFIYVLYLLFQLKSHAYLYQGTPQHIVDEQTEPGFLARFDTTSSSSRSTSISLSTAGSGASGHHRRVRKRLRAKLGMKRKTKTEISEELEESSPSQKTVAKDGAVSDTITQTLQAGQDDETGQSRLTEVSYNYQATTLPAPESHGTPLAPANVSARPTIRSGLTIRPPPVFRSVTGADVPVNRAAHSAPHQMRRIETSPNVIRQPTDGTISPQRRVGSNPNEEPESNEPPLSQTAAVILLLCSTALVALCAEFLVGSIEHLVASSPLSEAFVGLIILPIVGNAAEHVTAVTVAAKNKLDLALGVSLGSSIQIALFVTPIVVLLGWILDKSMSLYFTLFETASLFVSTFIVNFLVLDGRSNYLEGALLMACYIIIGVGAYFFPDGQDQSTLSGGTNST